MIEYVIVRIDKYKENKHVRRLLWYMMAPDHCPMKNMSHSYPISSKVLEYVVRRLEGDKRLAISENLSIYDI